MFYPVSGEKDAFSLCMETEGILSNGSTKKEDVS
jgi:hypothetical protein